MGIDAFRRNIAAAVKLLSNQQKGDTRPPWLNEKTIAGIPKAEFEALPDDAGFYWESLWLDSGASHGKLPRQMALPNGNRRKRRQPPFGPFPES